MRNLLTIVIILFVLGVVAYIVSCVASLGDFVASAMGFSRNAIGDPYVVYASLVAWIVSIVAVMTLLLIGLSIRRERVEA